MLFGCLNGKIEAKKKFYTISLDEKETFGLNLSSFNANILNYRSVSLKWAFSFLENTLPF